MKYKNVGEIAAAGGVPERSVRSYCTEGKNTGAVLNGKTRQKEESRKDIMDHSGLKYND